MVPPERIKYFIQKTLGCGCPEEVFQSIETRQNVRLNNFITLDSAIIIGDRLLVYIMEAGSAGCVEEHLPVLVAAGRNERDAKGLNRFRLVLVADDAEGLRKSAERQFEELRSSDKKVHLHVIGRKDLFITAKDAEEKKEDTKERR